VTIAIRRATIQDYNAVCELFDELDALHRDNLPHIFKKPNGPSRGRNHFLHLITDENAGLFVAETENRLVGLVEAVVKEMPGIPFFVQRRFVMIDSIVVHQSYQGRGIGLQLMDRINEWAVARGAASIELNAYEFNSSAIAFYKRLGYKTMSRRMERQVNK
jgi:ribosomal protein S18 acetylase RimI-like enzyme